MIDHPTRRTVTIGIATAAAALALPPQLANAATFTNVSTAEDAWRAACLETEMAWADENAARARILAQGVIEPCEWYLRWQLATWRQRAEASRDQLRATFHPRPRPRFEFWSDPQQVKRFTLELKRWKALASRENMQDRAARIDAAEEQEDMLASWLLSPESAAKAALRSQVRLRQGKIAPLPRRGIFLSAAPAFETGDAPLAGNDFTPEIYVRRLIALGYHATTFGRAALPPDAPEPYSMIRRRARLFACARSFAAQQVDAFLIERKRRL